MINHFKKLLYLSVLLASFSVFAGSYEDFFAAIKKDDISTVTTLLKRGFDANTRDENGLHGLHVALQEPSLKVATVLMDWEKTTVESRNAADESPLMLASLKGLLPVVVKLIQRGADVNKPGWAPLHYAATRGPPGGHERPAGEPCLHRRRIAERQHAADDGRHVWHTVGREAAARSRCRSVLEEHSRPDRHRFCPARQENRLGRDHCSICAGSTAKGKMVTSASWIGI